MIAVLLITALFIFISVYFYFRAEKLQQTLTLLKRETVKTQKDNKVLSKSMAIMSGKTEEFAKNRLQLLLNKTKDKETLAELALIKSFIDCYSLIFQEFLIKKGTLHTVTKKCFLNQEGDVYKDFYEKIIKDDTKIQRLWNSNNFVGFISLVEALLVKFEEQSKGSVVLKELDDTLVL